MQREGRKDRQTDTQRDKYNEEKQVGSGLDKQTNKVKKEEREREKFKERIRKR